MSESLSESTPDAAVAVNSCAQCSKTLTADDTVAASDRLFCRSCYASLRAELEAAVASMSADVNYPQAALGAVLVAGLFTMWQRWRHPVPGYHDIPWGSRLAVGIAYATLVVALALTLPIGLDVHPDIGL